MSVDLDLLKDFKDESVGLIGQMLETLEKAEGDFSQVKKLEDYGQMVDRIMGGAKSLAMAVDGDHFIHTVGDYAAICKAVGYKASQITDNPQFYDICVALLLDATEMLEQFVETIDEEKPKNIREVLSQTFLERLKWVNTQFKGNIRASVAVDKGAQKKKMDQSEIDDLLAKLGIG